MHVNVIEFDLKFEEKYVGNPIELDRGLRTSELCVEIKGASMARLRI